MDRVVNGQRCIRTALYTDVTDAAVFGKGKAVANMYAEGSPPNGDELIPWANSSHRHKYTWWGLRCATHQALLVLLQQLLLLEKVDMTLRIPLLRVHLVLLSACITRGLVAAVAHPLGDVTADGSGGILQAVQFQGRIDHRLQQYCT